jgi:aspartate/methionine/tyrosine aminotransferase
MIKRDTPIDAEVVRNEIIESGLEKIGKGSIREIVRLVNRLEQKTGEKFIRMEMGVPGLHPAKAGVEAEIKALKKGVASIYPNIEGISGLKKEISKFIKLFLDTDIKPEGCIPTVGSMMGAMASFMVANRNDHTKEGTLFIDPGFPVQKQQVRALGHEYCSFDIYDFRGSKLKSKLLTYFKTGRISSILYSNPNNPSWICFTDEELKIIGDLANKYDVIVIEDLAYFGMDFRKDYSKPGEPPFQPTVAKYTDNYILLISSSKAFSYAGQRVGMMAISDELFKRKYPDLLRYYTSDGFGYSVIYGALYTLSAGVTHSAQFGLEGILKSVNSGKYNYVEDVKEYGTKAKIMKNLFLNHGFKLVYDKDIDKPIADGFYFTISYPGFSGVDLLEELIYYGISAISLDITGSTREEGIRACVSLVRREQFGLLEERLKRFNEDHLY